MLTAVRDEHTQSSKPMLSPPMDSRLSEKSLKAQFSVVEIACCGEEEQVDVHLDPGNHFIQQSFGGVQRHKSGSSTWCLVLVTQPQFPNVWLLTKTEGLCSCFHSGHLSYFSLLFIAECLSSLEPRSTKWAKRKADFSETWEALFFMCAHSLQSCPTLHIPMDSKPPGSTGFPRQEYWNTVLQGCFLTQGSDSCLLHLLHHGQITTETLGKPSPSLTQVRSEVLSKPMEDIYLVTKSMISV